MYKTKHYISFSIIDTINAMFDFFTLLEWELINDISDVSKVYKPPGETVKDGDLYVHSYVLDNSIYVRVYTNYEVSTSTGYNLSFSPTISSRNYSNYTDIDNRTNLFFVGNKNYCMFNYSKYKDGSLYFNNVFGVGYIENIIYSLKKTCVDPISSGSNVTIELDDVSGLNKNSYYQILDVDGKYGCELVKISNIDENNKTVTLYSLTTSFPNGAYLGINIYNHFGVDNAGVKDFWNLYKVGSDQNNYLYSCNDIIYGLNAVNTPDQSIKDFVDGRFLLTSSIFGKSGGLYPVGYFGEEIKSWRSNYARNLGKTFLAYNEDNSDIKSNYSFITSVGEDYSYFTDTRKNWTVNSLINKYVCFIGGMGAWQTRKIRSNTNNTITFVNPIQEHIDKTSQYIIVDKVYRTLTTSGNVYLVALDTF